VNLELLADPFVKWSVSLKRQVLAIYLNPFSGVPVDPKTITVEKLVNAIIPAYQRALRERDALLVAKQREIDELTEKLRTDQAPPTTGGPDLSDPATAAVWERAEMIVDTGIAQDDAPTGDPGDPRPLEEIEPEHDGSIEQPGFGSLPGDEAAPGVGAPTAKPEGDGSNPTFNGEDVSHVLDLAEAKLKSWFGFGRKLAAADRERFKGLKMQLVAQAATFAMLKLDGDPFADRAIAQVAQSLPTVAMSLQLRAMTATREKVEADLREIVGALVTAGKTVAKAAALAVLA
jgi:hypothetical protein